MAGNYPALMTAQAEQPTSLPTAATTALRRSTSPHEQGGDGMENDCDCQSALDNSTSREGSAERASPHRTLLT